jgi:hypothetical protein
MTYHDALGLIVFGGLFFMLLCWYVWCLWTMFFVCQKPSHFFAGCYSTSGPFAIANGIAAVLGMTQIVVWITN